MPNHFDVLVIGAGPAGSHMASSLNEAGYSVAQAEEWRVGGTCLNAGCDPTKTMLESAHLLHRARHAAELGLVIPQASVDWNALRSRVRAVQAMIRGGDPAQGDQNVRDEGITLFKATARFIDAHTVELSGDEGAGAERITAERITADRIVIATGAEEVRPPIEGLDEANVLTNVEIVDIDALPRRLAIIGGGTISTEFGQMFQRLGVEVTIIGSDERMMPKEEPSLSDALESVLARDGVRFIGGMKVTRIEWRGSEQVLTGEDRDGNNSEVALADMILLAAGRKPNVDLGLDSAGVEYDDQAGIAVDAFARTNVPHIWAIGDCATSHRFTHVASFQASILAGNIRKEIAGDGEPKRVSGQVIPWVTFTEPELARVGMTEAEAMDAGLDIVTAQMPIAEQTRPLAANKQDGLVKLVVERGSGRILGGHVLSARAGEMLSEIVLAMQHDLPVSAISGTIHSYPTFSGVLEFVAREAAGKTAGA
ncbi:MAG TPA: FAD-dependent oxidoreductase [Thermomicrobiales bacterium]|jgi:pyruvate/2-oxoglutarate dehydrogenase complex dihydrolipoamide dehydrogenase (E3) component|nr:FAD-dependent oxidoreductase [Thermomicrobiales bacterium]